MEKVYPIGGLLKIGYSPEHRVRSFRFDIAKFLVMWPETKPCMLLQRKGDSTTYIADTKMDGTHIIWSVSRYDTDKVGSGSMWVAFYGENGKQLGLTPKTTFTVEDGPPSINGYMPPEMAMPWVQQVLDAASRIEDMVIQPLVISAPTVDEFPSIGKSDAIYKASNEKRLYQWNDTLQKYEPLSVGQTENPERPDRPNKPPMPPPPHHKPDFSTVIGGDSSGCGDGSSECCIPTMYGGGASGHYEDGCCASDVVYLNGGNTYSIFH